MSALIVLVGSAAAAPPPGRLVRMSRASAVYAKPSAAAKILADVDAGTLLFLRRVSPQKTWLFVEDESGNRGWVPHNRTDYVNLPVPSEEGAFKKQEERVNDAPPKLEVDSGWRHQVTLLGRAAFKDPHAHLFSGGLSYFLGLPVQPPGALVERERHMGPEVGFWLALKEGNSFAFTVPLRFRLLGRDADSRFYSGPDLGMLFMYQSVAGLGGDTFWSLSLGYSVGFGSITGRGFFVSLRPGVEFFNSTRLSIESRLGWTF